MMSGNPSLMPTGLLTKLQPGFDARLCGFKKLGELVKTKTDVFLFEAKECPWLKWEISVE